MDETANESVGSGRQSSLLQRCSVLLYSNVSVNSLYLFFPAFFLIFVFISRLFSFLPPLFQNTTSGKSPGKRKAKMMSKRSKNHNDDRLAAHNGSAQPSRYQEERERERERERDGHDEPQGLFENEILPPSLRLYSAHGEVWGRRGGASACARRRAVHVAAGHGHDLRPVTRRVPRRACWSPRQPAKAIESSCDAVQMPAAACVLRVV